jgi:WD40 repeat protein
MSFPGEAPEAGAETSLLEWVDEVADRFEAAWKQGPPPRIAAFLGDAIGARRAALLQELVKIDLAYRGRGGDHRQLADYLVEFPELIAAKDGQSSEGGRQEDGPGSRLTCSASLRGETANGDPAADVPRRLGRFQLLELVGRGSFGTVYKAQDEQLDRVVAIKVPRAGSFGTHEEEQRFLGEARSAAQLNHPHIVPIHEVAYEGAMPFLVCEYVEGRTLKAVLAEGRLGLREAAELTARVADALAYAHRHKVVHRDVNPRNILIDAAGQPHVTDFGLARRQEASTVVTLEGQILGTPAYMPPEQAAGEQSRVDGRSDVYSLGVVFYELLTGDLPFRGNLSVLLHQVLYDEPRPPRKLNDRLPRDLETICLKAMAKAPARRYATAGDLAADLRRYLAGVPILARPVGPGERLWRWCRRNPLVASLMALVFGLLVAATVTALLWAVQRGQLAEQERKDRRRAEELLAESSQAQVSRGLRLLEEKDSRGLLDLLEARKQVKGIPQARESRSVLWSGWYAACAGRLKQVLGGGGPIFAVTFVPPNERLLLTIASGDGTARLWDTATGLPHGKPFRIAHRGKGLYYPEPLKASLSPDAQWLATVADGTGTIQVRDTATGRPYPRAFAEPLRGDKVLFSPDGKWLATARVDAVRLWDLATGNPHGPLLRLGFPLEGIKVLAFSPDGRFLAAGSQQNDNLKGVPTKLWEVATGRGWALDPGHDPGVYAVAFSPDSKLLATASWDGTARLWDTATGTPRSAPLRHGEHLHAVAFSPDGRLLATGAFDLTARLWDVATGRLLHRLRHDGAVLNVAFSPDSKLLAAGSLTGTVRIWKTASGEQGGWPVRHQDTVTALAFRRDGRLLATSSLDGTARLWDLKAVGPRVLEHSHRVWAVAFSSDGKLLATASEDGWARVWDTSSWRLRAGPLRHPDRTLLAVAFSPDGKLLATAAGLGVQFWDTARGYRRAKFLRSAGNTRYVTFSPDGKFLAEGADMAARLWEVSTWRRIGPPLATKEHITALTFHPDGRLLAVASKDGLVQLWDRASGVCRLPPLRHASEVKTLAFSPDGKWLATATRSLTVRLWDTATWQLHGQPLHQQAFVEGLAFSPDSQRLATASSDGTVRLWDLVTGLPCGPALEHPAYATAVAFSPDGKWLATGAFDRRVRLWPVPARVTGLAEMELRTWVALGARLNGRGGVEAIHRKEWRRLRRKLQTLEASRRQQAAAK